MTFGVVASSHPLAALDYSGEILADSPLGYWRLGESSGTSAADSSGNARHGTYQNAPTLGATGLIAGDADTSVDFDGSTHYVTIPDDAAWDTTTVTVEAWINADTSGDIIAGRYGSASADKCWALDVLGSSNTVRFYVHNTSGTAYIAEGSTTISLGTTYHIVGTFDGDKPRVYVNGSLDGAGPSLSGTWTNESATTDILIGHRDGSAGSTRWDGRVDEVAVYGSVLSTTRIAAHYAAGS